MNTKKNPAEKFLALIFRNNFFLSSILKCVSDESCRGSCPQTSPKGLLLMAQTDFVHTDEDLEIILRDLKNAPFYILCLFHKIDSRMFSLSFLSSCKMDHDLS